MVDAIESQLSLSKELVEPSRAGLYRFGNISSSSIWCGRRGSARARSRGT